MNHTYTLYENTLGKEGSDLIGGKDNISIEEAKKICNNNGKCTGFNISVNPAGRKHFKYYLGNRNEWVNQSGGKLYVKDAYKNDGFTFHANKHFNNGNYKQFNNWSAHAIAVECINDPICKAFDTDGWLKREVPTITNWNTNWGASTETSKGIYIKDKNILCSTGKLDPFGKECNDYCVKNDNCFNIYNTYCDANNILNNENCKKWSLDNNGSNDHNMGIFCSSNPNDPICACINSEIECPNKFDTKCITPTAYKTNDMLNATCPPVMNCNQYINLSPEAQAIAVKPTQTCETTTNGETSSSITNEKDISNETFFNKFKIPIIVGSIIFILLFIFIIIISITSSTKKNNYDDYDDYDDY